MSRTVDCPCGVAIVGQDDDEVVDLATQHLAEYHPGREYSRDMILMMAR